MNGSYSHCKPRRRPQVTSGTSQFIRAAPHQIEVLCFLCSFYALGLCGLHERCHETDLRVRLMQGLLLYAQSLLCFIGKCNRTHSVTHKQIYDLKLATITNNTYPQYLRNCYFSQKATRSNISFVRLPVANASACIRYHIRWF